MAQRDSQVVQGGTECFSLIPSFFLATRSTRWHTLTARAFAVTTAVCHGCQHAVCLAHGVLQCHTIQFQV